MKIIYFPFELKRLQVKYYPWGFIREWSLCIVGHWISLIIYLKFSFSLGLNIEYTECPTVKNTQLASKYYFVLHDSWPPNHPVILSTFRIKVVIKLLYNAANQSVLLISLFQGQFDNFSFESKITNFKECFHLKPFYLN